MDKLKGRLIPGRYFHIVFSVPHLLNPLFYINQSLATANIKTKRQQTIALIGKTIWQPILEGLNAYEVYRTLRGSDPARCPKCNQGIMERYSMETAPG